MPKAKERENRICLHCGKGFKFLVTPTRLALGRGKYCSRSCASRITSTTHGHTKNRSQTATYSSYAAMIARCHKPYAGKFKEYGAAGVIVCERWRSSFDNFLSDMGEKPHGATLDRWPNQDGNYEPGNCRWATPKQQQQNIKTNRLIEFNGVSQCLSEWARQSGVPKSTLRHRIEAGWPMAEALKKRARQPS